MKSLSAPSLSEELWTALGEALSKSDRVVEGNQAAAALFGVAVEFARVFEVDPVQHALAQVVNLGAGTPADEKAAVDALRELFASRRKLAAVDEAFAVPNANIN